LIGKNAFFVGFDWYINEFKDPVRVSKLMFFGNSSLQLPESGPEKMGIHACDNRRVDL